MASFKKIEKKNNKDKTDYSFFIMIFFIVLFVVAIVLFFVLNETPKTEKYISKIDSSKDYVYTVKKEKNETQEATYNKVPAFNIGGSSIEKINKKINSDYEDIKKYVEYEYSYKFNQSDNLLSLLITYTYLPKEATYPVTSYKSYNIDLEQGLILSNSDLLKMYDVTKAQLTSFIENKFKTYYNDLIEKKVYSESTCNYTCFLNNRGISSNYLRGVSLYVDNGELTVYKFYYKLSDYEGEESYFDDISYQISVKSTK